MKTILTFFILILSLTNLDASCAWNGLTAFPSGKTICQNSIFVIEGYNVSQEVIVKLNKEYPIYLESGKSKVKLIVKELLVGQFRLTQAVLVPETKLTIGKEYTLIIKKLPEHEWLNKWDSDLKRGEKVIYQVVQNYDSIKPIFGTYPKEINKSYLQLGCGPSANIKFECNVIDNSEFLINAKVKSLKTGKEVSYYLRPYNGTISIGHGMCSGEFTFDEGVDYEVEFSIMDAAGNYTAWTDEPIKFTKPTKLNTGGKP